MVFSHFVICNDTQETLRFGQVDTDENVLLASLHRHQYSWRSHRSPQVLEKQPYKHVSGQDWGFIYSAFVCLCPVTPLFKSPQEAHSVATSDGDTEMLTEGPSAHAARAEEQPPVRRAAAEASRSGREVEL